MKCLILLCLVAGAFAFLDCPANQHYDSCGTDCPLTCDNYKNPPKICNLMCVAGCHCDAGYVKNELGECVMPEQCPNQASVVCGENAHFTGCGTDCPLTCDNYKDAPLVCNFMCKIGCECDKGYVRSAVNNACVLPENCPAKSHDIVKSCLGEAETGMCRAYIPSWHYDVKTGSCHKFIYGGCGGNGNRYASEEECMEHCGAIKHKQSSSDVCDLPAKSGHCLAYFPRYFYNKESEQCEKFIYGGCQGNGNNFKTLEECQETCQHKTEFSVCGENERYNECGTFCPLTCDNYQNPPMICPLACKIGCECEKGYVRAHDGQCVLPEHCPAQALNRPDCHKEPEVGMCRGLFERFYYDQEAGMCKTFIYGGCGGNMNNFETESECYNRCGALAAPESCHQAKEVGPCRGAFPRYAFNPDTGKCEYFIFGGCGGNDNNFDTTEECEAVCLNYS